MALDGNKRAALATTLAFLEMNGVVSKPSNADVVALTLEVAAGALRDVATIAGRIAILFPDA